MGAETKKIEFDFDSASWALVEKLAGIDPASKDPFMHRFSSQEEQKRFLSMVSNTYKRKSGGKNVYTCQRNSTKRLPEEELPTENKRQATEKTKARLRKSKLIPQDNHCKATLKVNPDPALPSITITGHTCDRKFSKIPKYLTEVIDTLLKAQIESGMDPNTARGVVNAQITNSIMAPMIPPGTSLTKHINNRCIRLRNKKL